MKLSRLWTDFLLKACCVVLAALGFNLNLACCFGYFWEVVFSEGKLLATNCAPPRSELVVLGSSFLSQQATAMEPLVLVMTKETTTTMMGALAEALAALAALALLAASSRQKRTCLCGNTCALL